MRRGQVNYSAAKGALNSATAFLASGEAAYIGGQIISVNGTMI